jgi:hypothetical protein
MRDRCVSLNIITVLLLHSLFVWVRASSPPKNLHVISLQSSKREYGPSRRLLFGTKIRRTATEENNEHEQERASNIPLIQNKYRDLEFFDTRGGAAKWGDGGGFRSAFSSGSTFFSRRRVDDDSISRSQVTHDEDISDAEDQDDFQFRTQENGEEEGRYPFLESLRSKWPVNFPRVQIRVEPTTTLKVRKSFRPLKTLLTVGADFNTQLGIWQFHSSWEDEIIGSQLTLVGRELQVTKTWLFSVGAVEDLVTRLRLRAALDLKTMRAYARVGFRTERLSPINIMEGFTIWKQVPLDGNKGHVKMEFKANVALPEPELEFNSDHKCVVGMGDIDLSLDELNLILDY